MTTWESYLREAGLQIDSHFNIQDERIAGLLAENSALNAEIVGLKQKLAALKSPPPATLLLNDPLMSVPKEGPYHLDAPANAFSVLNLGERQALVVWIRKDQPLRGSNQRCKSEFGPRDNPTVEKYRRFPQGERLFFGMDIYVPLGWPVFSHKVPIWSFRSSDDEAHVALRISGKRLYLYYKGLTNDQNPAVWQVPVDEVRGKWTRFVFDNVFSSSSALAKTRLYVNGVQVVNSQMPNGYYGGDLYTKFGLYVPAWSQPERAELEAAGKLEPGINVLSLGLSNFRVGSEANGNKLEDFLA